MSAIKGFGAGKDCFAALCFGCFALNSFLNRTAFPYDKPSLVKIGESASLKARSVIESLSFIFCSEM